MEEFENEFPTNCKRIDIFGGKGANIKLVSGKVIDLVKYSNLKTLAIDLVIDNNFSCYAAEMPGFKIINIPKSVNYIDLCRFSRNCIDISKLHSNIRKLELVMSNFNDLDLANLPANLIELLIWHPVKNSISNLDCLPKKLKNLRVVEINSLLSLDNLPTELIKLELIGTGITNLDFLPDSIKILICSENKITQIDNLPSGIIELDCSKNYLSSLTNLPNNLEKLKCSYNKGPINLIILPKSVCKADIEGCVLLNRPICQSYLTLVFYTLEHKNTSITDMIIGFFNNTIYNFFSTFN